MEVYGKECMSRTRVFEWHKRFHEGRTDVEDDERSRRPTISKTTNNNREIEKIVREDRRLSIRLIERMSFDKETVWQAEVESSRTSLASRTSSRTHFEVLGLGLGLEGQVLGLGLEASSPRKLACPRLEDSTIF